MVKSKRALQKAASTDGVFNCRAADDHDCSQPKQLPRRHTVAVGEDARLAERCRSVTLHLLEGDFDCAALADQHAKDEFCGKEDEVTTDSGGPSFFRTIPVLFALVVVFGCASVFPFEWLVTRDKGCGDLVLLIDYIQNLFTAAPQAWKGRQASGSWSIPLHFNLLIAGGNCGYSMLLNVAMQTSLPMPVIIVLKNGGLVASLVVGLVCGCRYGIQQVVSVLVVTAGLVATTFSGQQPSNDKPTGMSLSPDALLGVALITGALFMRAFTSALQEVVMKRSHHGAPVAETMLFRSLCGIPILIMQHEVISKHWAHWNAPSLGNLPWPSVWVLLGGKLVFDYIMRNSTCALLVRTNALTVSTVLAFQRFLSFVLSILVVNPMSSGGSAMLWVGSLAVCGGGVAYATAPRPFISTASKREKTA